jgi:hypothetical protein
MKLRSLVASAAIVAALPLSAIAQGNATTLAGPQGTGWYGWVDPLDLDRTGRAAPPNAGAGATVPPDVARYDLNADGIISQGEYTLINEARVRRGAYSGASWATNPPVPPQ